jgi:hypothetical protein
VYVRLRRITALTMVLAGSCLVLPARAEQVRLDPGGGPRIVNGIDTHAYPTTGGLLFSQGSAITPNNAILWCSGTLIGCHTFLVAGHCVDDPNPNHYLVYLQNVGLAPVASITRHPSFTEATFPLYDVAVIKLADWVTGVNPMPINQTNPIPFIPATGTIVGYGQTLGGANDYGIKRAGTVHTKSCPNDLPSGATNTDVVCWSFTAPLGLPGSNSNTCNGDSGGPLLLDLGLGAVVAGTTSGGTSVNCLPVDNSYDANVYTHRAFILGQLGSDGTSACGGLAPVGDAQTSEIDQDGALSSLHGSDSFTVNVPAGVNALRVVLNGEDNGTFDPNLYVKQGTDASPTNFDCKADGTSVFGGCTFDLPAAGTWSIDVVRAAGSGQYQLTTTIFGGAAPTCGNGTREFDEACDGADAALCPGLCRADCTCPTPVCGNGVIEVGEQCDGSNAPSCPGQCDATCHCPTLCTEGDLIVLPSHIDATRFKLHAVLLNFDGSFDGADPRQGFAISLTQGTQTAAIIIPSNDPGWAHSQPTRGRYMWEGSVAGIRRVRALDRSLQDGTWRITVIGQNVPGTGTIDFAQSVDMKLTVGGACTTAAF